MGGKRIAAEVRRALIAAAKATSVFVALDASGCSSSSSCVGKVTCAAEASGGQSVVGCPALAPGGAPMDCAGRVSGGAPMMGCIAQCPAMPCAAVAGGPPVGTGGTAGAGGRIGTGGSVGPRDAGRDRWVPDASSGSDADASPRDK